MKKFILSFICVCSLSLAAYAQIYYVNPAGNSDFATANAIDNLNIGMWARQLSSDNYGGDDLFDVIGRWRAKSKAAKAAKQQAKLAIKKTYNGNIIIDGKEYAPVENANIKPVTYNKDVTTIVRTKLDANDPLRRPSFLTDSSLNTVSNNSSSIEDQLREVKAKLIEKYPRLTDINN